MAEQVRVSVLPNISELPPPSYGTEEPATINEKPAHVSRHSDSSDLPEKESIKSDIDAGSQDVIIRTGADAANHLLSIRDDGDPSLTVRSMVLGTLIAAFQASLNQIYNFKPTGASISGSFIVLIIWFLGRAWAAFLPRGDILEQRWLQKNDATTRRPWWLKAAILINPRPFSLKEHAVAAITASSASNGTASLSVFAVQNLFYGIPLTATTVILSTLSIGLFGYGLTGLLRPITVWHVEAVYWSNIPLVSVLQSLHWDDIRSSKPLRVFWYAFGGMAVYEFFPAYIFPWLNSVSIPCLAAMHATGSKAAILTNLFGGSISNEGLGILNFTFDWQYITSFSTSLPLILQMNQAIGIFICYIAMIAVYYGNAWNAKGFPFMATTLRAADGSRYPSRKVFINGVLDQSALEKYGIPHLAGTYTWALVTGNAAIGALIGHCFFFWGKDVVGSVKRSLKGQHDDRHHAAMSKYKEAPWHWYLGTLIIAFVFGLVAVLKEDISLPAWAYVVALLLGVIIAPFSSILYSRFGNGIATNSLMKMLAGVTIPGRPLGNLYFSAWSHSVIAQSLNLAADLKLGEYLKIPPRVMFLTQVWGTVFGAFINYVVMISVINEHRELLTDTNGSYAWSGQAFQSLDTQATTWALSRYMYTIGAQYVLVPVGLIIGFGLVLIHRLVANYVPRVGRFSIRDLNIPTILMYSGWMGYNQTQSCVVLSSILAGFYVQYYLRNYRPRIYKEYSYLVTAALDGGSLLVIFILSFAVFGAAGPQKPFPSWWGNPAEGFPDHCPDPSAS